MVLHLHVHVQRLGIYTLTREHLDSHKGWMIITCRIVTDLSKRVTMN
jgi:hypothetical protein